MTSAPSEAALAKSRAALLRLADLAGDRDAAAEAARRAIDEGLVAVKKIDEDLVLRGYAALVGAILRTNAFVPAGREALAFKIDSAAVPRLPRLSRRRWKPPWLKRKSRD